MDKETTIQKVISGFAWEGSTKFVVQLFTWATTIIVARILVPEDYGVVAISGVFTGILLIITDMGFMAALINMKEVERDDFDSVFWLNILLSAVLFTLIYFLAPLIGQIYGSEILVDIIRVSALVLPLGSLKIVPLAIALRNMDYKYRALVEMAGQFAMATSSIILATMGYGVWTLVYAVIIGQIVVVAAYLPLLKSFPRLVINVARIKEIASYGLYLMGSEILGFLTKRADVMIIGLFLTDKQVGFYSMGFHLATLPLDKIGSIFNSVAFPAVSRIKENTAFAKSLFLNMHKYLLLVTYPILVGFALVAEDLVLLLLTEKWMPLVPVLQALCILNLLRISGMIMPFIMAGLGHPKAVFQFNTLGSIVLPVAFLVGAQYGLSGVLLSWFLAYPIMYYFLLTLLSRKLNMSNTEFFKSGISALVCTAIMAAVVYFGKLYYSTGSNTLDLGITIVLGASVYMLSNVMFFPHELTNLKSRIKDWRSSKVA